MKTNAQFRNRLKTLFDTQKLAALSTHFMGQPYTSLIAFYADERLEHIYFVTPETTRKYANLTADNRVSIMVNNSTNQVDDFHQAVSVTVVGRAETVTGAEKEKILPGYLAKHPHLVDFARSPTSALVRVDVASYVMVKQFQNVMELHLNHKTT